MNFVYLSPYFPPNFRDFVRGLHEAGARVLGIGETPRAEMPDSLLGWLHDYRKVDNMQDYDQVYRAFASFIADHGRIERVEANQEFWMETEARLRSDFNLAGYKSEDMRQIKSKWAMKQRYQEFGVPVARGALASDPKAVGKLARQAGFPLVAKPDVGVGAAATYRLENEEQLRQFLDHPPDIEYVLEEYLSGQLCTYDGLADSQADPVFVASHGFSTGIMEVVNDDADLFYYSERHIPDDLEQLGRTVLKAFNVRQRFFHLEFFRTPDGYRALEANLRAPGALTVNMMCWANDADVFRHWAEVVCHDRRDLPCPRLYHVGYYARREGRSYRLSHQQVLDQYKDQFVHYHVNEPIFRQATGDTAYILRSPDMSVLSRAAGEIFAAP